MRFSIEDILRKDESPRTRPDSRGWSCSDSDSSSSSPRCSTPESRASSISDCSDDVFIKSPESHSARKHRAVISRRHKQELESAFRNNQYRSRSGFSKLAIDLGLPPHLLKVWFRNRRAKQRKQGDGSQHSPMPERQSPLNSNTYSAIEIRPEGLAYAGPMLCNVRSYQPMMRNSRPVCNCASCMQDVLYAMHKRRQFEQSFPLPNLPRGRTAGSYTAMCPSKIRCSSNQVCCCTECREGTFYAQY